MGQAPPAKDFAPGSSWDESVQELGFRASGLESFQGFRALGLQGFRALGL